MRDVLRNGSIIYRSNEATIKKDLNAAYDVMYELGYRTDVNTTQRDQRQTVDDFHSSSSQSLIHKRIEKSTMHRVAIYALHVSPLVVCQSCIIQLNRYESTSHEASKKLFDRKALVREKIRGTSKRQRPPFMCGEP
ncbi:hypothetical protein EVAR_23136_1 [Eumeta japonica]|uniref:Uncharacterized protein n=1 Tax=Eumeta variegata TaxID=151549 RepID=A0A4C1VC89_EUMVA|nr:hypothetical protein EVAR_23136_1 [Eumeta japonica]